MGQVKLVIQSFIVAIALIIAFSASRPMDHAFKPIGSIGTQYSGDSGMVIPGDGTDFADIIIQAEASRPEPQKTSETLDEVEPEQREEDWLNAEIEMEKQDEMGDMVFAFWHGVLSVLIGEAAALMVAAVYLKIKKSGD